VNDGYAGYLKSYAELRRSVILPALEKIRVELEQDGWYCFIADLNPFDKIEGITPRIPDRYGFTSLSIMDIENGIVQYVFVFLENHRVRLTSDVFEEDKGVFLDLTEVSLNSVEETVKMIINR
jgi:hypothetical protein